MLIAKEQGRYIRELLVNNIKFMKALDKQVGGDHYKKMLIQVVEFCHKNNIRYMEGSVIKYIVRWRDKNGIEDLEKAKHYIELIIEMEKDNEKLNETLFPPTNISKSYAIKVPSSLGVRYGQDNDSNQIG